MFRANPLVRCSVIVTLLAGLSAPAALAQGSGRISGSVTDPDGNPIAGANIRAEKPDANPPVFETTTDSDGRFSIIGFVSGTWSFTATAEGFQPNTGTARITQSRNSPINIELVRELHRLEQALGAEALEGLDPDAIEQELSDADTAYNAQNWDAAIAGYNGLIEKLPQMSNLNLQIGNAYRAKGEYDEAITHYELVLADDPDNENAKAEIARTKLAMGDLDAASEELAAAASGLNASREDLYNLGELEFAKGNVDVAAEWYEKATMVDPNWGKPLFKLALVALNKGDTETAKQYFEKVVAADPNSEEAAQAKATIAALP